MADLRSRKPVNEVRQKQPDAEDRSKSKPVKRNAEADLEPNIFVTAIMFVVFSLVVGSLIWYKVDSRESGPFAAWVDDNYPSINKALSWPSTPLFGAAAEEVTGQIKLTEEELKAYDGTDDKPIYLAIDGTIFDVSASPAFYGPGGHYHHFVGKDATRAWITECWDEPEQFTWRMDDVDVMFMPKYLDETLEEAGSGEFGDGFGEMGSSPKEAMQKMAKQALEKLGPVSKAEKKKRRKSDVKEAADKTKETLEHWVKFFKDNDKYKIIGSVIHDESRPAPPKPCKKAFEKRPLKGGKLDSLMGAGANMANIMGGGAGMGKKAPKDKKPDFVKNKSADEKKKAAAEKKKKEAAEKKKKEAEEQKKREAEEKKRREAMVTPKAEDLDNDEDFDDDGDDDVYHEEL